MPDHRLCRVDLNILRVLTERELDRPRLKQIIVVRRRSVRVDIRDILRRCACVLYRTQHRCRCACAVLRRGSDVKCIRRAAISHNLRINLSAARLCMFKLLQHDNPCALAHDKAASVLVKRNGTARGVLADRQRRQGRKARDANGRDGALCTACHHDVCVAVLNRPKRLPDGVCACGARCHHIDALAFEIVSDAHIARRHVGNHQRHQKRCNSRRSLLL